MAACHHQTSTPPLLTPRLRYVLHCLPKVTHSSDIMRHTQHWEASLFFPLPERITAQLLSLHASYTTHKLLNPQNTLLWDSTGATLQGREVWSGIFQSAGLSCYPPGSRGGGYSRRASRFSALATTVQSEKQRKEPKLLTEVGQPRKEKTEKRGRSKKLREQMSLHL